jgi:hypothetical protein
MREERIAKRHDKTNPWIRDLTLKTRFDVLGICAGAKRSRGIHISIAPFLCVLGAFAVPSPRQNEPVATPFFNPHGDLFTVPINNIFSVLSVPLWFNPTTKRTRRSAFLR